ncbi:MAG: hypothetical protein PHG45_05370 [Dehalococcoidales bacterium]|nr:hypothetical protein [Dehalococcoidales bacterium]
MPSFPKQSWKGYEFRLYPNSVIRRVVYWVYHYLTVYLNNQHIAFDLLVYPPKDNLEPIKYEWDIYDKKTKEAIILDSDIKRTGLIEFVKDKNKVKVISNGQALEKTYDSSQIKTPYYFSLNKAVNLGYVVEDMKCFIKMKFKIGEEEIVLSPMASFNVYDKDDIHKTLIELAIGAGIGVVIGFIMSGIVG